MAKSPLRAPAVVKLGEPADMAAAIPHLVGFEPQESLVVVSMRRPRKRIGLTMRFDLPPVEYDADVAEQIALRLAADKADFAMVACCTDEVPAVGPHPRSALIAQIETALEVEGINLLDALLIRGGRWWSYRCDEPSCCPAEGTEIPAATDIAAAHAFIGRGVLPSRAALQEQLKPVELVAARAMRQALDRAETALAHQLDTDGWELTRATNVAFVRGLIGRYAESPRATVTDDEAAQAIVCLLDVHTRDQILAAAIDADLDGAQRLFIDLCRRSLPPDDAPTCTVLAGLAYADGNGALANVALERALVSDPSYSLARLFRDALYQQVPPSALRRAWKAAAVEPLCGPPASRPAKKNKGRFGRTETLGG